MHLLQSEYWREVKKQEGNGSFDIDGVFMQTTKIPVINKFAGYIPRADLKNIDLKRIQEVAKQNKVIFVKVDPLNLKKDSVEIENKGFKLVKTKAVQLQNNVIIDTSKPEDELLSKMSKNHRYCVKLATKKGVNVEINNTSESFKEFLELYKKTVLNQKYSARSEKYITTVWNVMKSFEKAKNIHLANIAIAKVEEKPIAGAMVVNVDNVLYYLYAGSDEIHRNLMPGYAIIWELIKFCKKEDIKYLDLVGIEKDTSKGFSRFKIGFGGDIVEYQDSFDLTVNSFYYKLFKMARKIIRK